MANTEKTSSMGNLQRNGRWLLALGILFVILGVIGLGMTVSLTLVSMLFFGFLLVIAGVSQLVDAFYHKGWKPFMGHLFIALLYVIAGGTVIYDPFLASTLITGILAFSLIIIGVTRLILAFSVMGSSGWGFILLSAICSLLLGFLILMQWPLSGLWVIGLFIAIELLFSGWTYILLGLAM